MDRDITVVSASHSKLLHGCLVHVKNIFNCNHFASIFTCLIAFHDMFIICSEQEVWPGDGKNTSIKFDCTESIEIRERKQNKKLQGVCHKRCDTYPWKAAPDVQNSWNIWFFYWKKHNTDVA